MCSHGAVPTLNDHDEAAVAATFCATLADEWARAGVTDAVIAPGSRSTPLAMALAADGRLRVHVFHDERSASFCALGLGLATRRPAVLVCTSGTAAVELHAAVVEAHQAAVPLLACTADRPPELLDVGAPQTVDQVGLYGRAVRWAANPGPPLAGLARTWRPLAARAVLEALGPRPGPVHLNLAFREPLVGEALALPAGRADGAPWHGEPVAGLVPPRHATEYVAALLAHERGVIVAGGGAPRPELVHAAAGSLGWPVLADPRSGARTPAATTVAAFDALLRAPGFAREMRPDAVLAIGAPPASKVLAQWLAGSGAHLVVADPAGRWLDPEHLAGNVLRGSPEPLLQAFVAGAGGVRPGSGGEGWLARWQRAEQAAQASIDAVLGRHAEPTEPGLARALLAALPHGAALVVSSSMPVRDVEWFGAPRSGVEVFANRGANGIDGVVSTAVGVALADTTRPTVALLGDLAFLHDTNGLLRLADREVNLTLVVVDNSGGGIFSFLPQAAALPQERFEHLFGTPHGVDLAALAAVHHLPAIEVHETAYVGAAIEAAFATPGASLVLARTDRQRNVAVHDELNAAVAAAVAAAASA
jgi:2-succinyl-5-enolpyruvyl-6-hydroxy-3-cyclohexene-1-carboxylate synthase